MRCKECAAEKPIKGRGLCSKCYAVDWKARNPDRTSKYRAQSFEKRKRDLIRATPSWLSRTQLEDIAAVYDLKREMSALYPERLAVDHIVPLNGKNVCGLHVAWNLQVLTAEHNFEKLNK